MRALVLSGGGSRGAYQVGVIKRLTELGRSWDLIAGVSVGAINAAAIAMHPPGDQRGAALRLEQFWCDIQGNESVYSKRFPLAALWAGSLYDTAPLERLIRSHFDLTMLRSSGVKLRIGAVDLESGLYRQATEEATDPVRWIMASAAFPGAFPPVLIESRLYVDGGIRDCTPIQDVLDEGAIDIDIVLCNPQFGDTTLWNLRKAASAIEVGLRSAEIMADEVFLTDLESAYVSDTPFRVYAPPAPWKLGALDFEPREIRRMIEFGYGQA